MKRMKVEEIEVSEEEKETLKRPDMPMLPVEKRKTTFEKATIGLTDEMARNEAKRCLRVIFMDSRLSLRVEELSPCLVKPNFPGSNP
jgi:hypothetical protein